MTGPGSAAVFFWETPDWAHSSKQSWRSRAQRALGHRHRSCSDPWPEVLCAFTGKQIPLAAESCSPEWCWRKKESPPPPFFHLLFWHQMNPLQAFCTQWGCTVPGRPAEHWSLFCAALCAVTFSDSVSCRARRCCHSTGKKKHLSQLPTNNRSR